jgi:hypothetical protein
VKQKSKFNSRWSTMAAPFGTYHVSDDHLHLRIRENPARRTRRFVLFSHGKAISRHDSIEDARTAYLVRLILRQ